jgi:hypothetical protein
MPPAEGKIPPVGGGVPLAGGGFPLSEWPSPPRLVAASPQWREGAPPRGKSPLTGGMTPPGGGEHSPREGNNASRRGASAPAGGNRRDRRGNKAVRGGNRPVRRGELSPAEGADAGGQGSAAPVEGRRAPGRHDSPVILLFSLLSLWERRAGEVKASERRGDAGGIGPAGRAPQCTPRASRPRGIHLKIVTFPADSDEGDHPSSDALKTVAFSLEQVVAFRRNQRSPSIGFGGRLRAENASSSRRRGWPRRSPGTSRPMPRRKGTTSTWTSPKERSS